MKNDYIEKNGLLFYDKPLGYTKEKWWEEADGRMAIVLADSRSKRYKWLVKVLPTSKDYNSDLMEVFYSDYDNGEYTITIGLDKEPEGVSFIGSCI